MSVFVYIQCAHAFVCVCMHACVSGWTCMRAFILCVLMWLNHNSIQIGRKKKLSDSHISQKLICSDSSVQFSSRWYLCVREGPYALHPISGVSPMLPLKQFQFWLTMGLSCPLKEECWALRLSIRQYLDMDNRIFNVRTWYACVYTQGLGAPTAS